MRMGTRAVMSLTLGVGSGVKVGVGVGGGVGVGVGVGEGLANKISGSRTTWVGRGKGEIGDIQMLVGVGVGVALAATAGTVRVEVGVKVGVGGNRSLTVKRTPSAGDTPCGGKILGEGPGSSATGLTGLFARKIMSNVSASGRVKYRPKICQKWGISQRYPTTVVELFCHEFHGLARR